MAFKTTLGSKEITMQIPTPTTLAQDPELALLSILTLSLSPTEVFEDAIEWIYSVWRQLPPAEQDYFDLVIDYIYAI
jgi:predicted MPP superfamily phosphohydrolase